MTRSVVLSKQCKLLLSVPWCNRAPCPGQGTRALGISWKGISWHASEPGAVLPDPLRCSEQDCASLWVVAAGVGLLLTPILPWCVKDLCGPWPILCSRPSLSPVCWILIHFYFNVNNKTPKAGAFPRVQRLCNSPVGALRRAVRVAVSPLNCFQK